MPYILENIKKIYSPMGNGYLSGEDQGKIEERYDETIYVKDGKFQEEDHGGQRIDCSNLIAIPGLIDSHTHMVYAGGREQEFVMRARGVTYLDLLKSGNGIGRTIKTTSESDEKTILNETLERLIYHIIHGATTVEMKTGYGKGFEDEKKMVNVMYSLERISGVRIIKTALPMHSRPPANYGRDFVEDSIETMKKLMGMVDFTDVFCDAGAFTVEETERYLHEAQKNKVKIRLHADELQNIGATALAESFKIYSMDHLLKTDEKDLVHFKRGNSSATILPITAFSLGEEYADARKFIDSGIPVSIASDVSPLSPVPNMQFAGNLAIRKCSMSPEEVLTAMTANPASSLDIKETAGRIRDGMSADMLLFRASSLEDIFYRWDSLTPDIIIVKGKMINVKEIFSSMLKQEGDREI